jgi:hypothetical protein
MAQEPKTYTVPQGSIEVLKAFLPRGEWYKETPAQFVWGCMLLEDPAFTDKARPMFDALIPDKDDHPAIQRYNQAQQEWLRTVDQPYMDAPASLTLTTRQAQAIETMIRFFIKAGACTLNKYALRIIQALEIDFDEDTPKKK